MVKNAISLFARVKPEKNETEVVNYKIHRRPKKHSNEDFLVLTAPQRPSEYIDNRPESWNFSFHRIFDHEVAQEDIFENVARPIINSAFDGYNGTIFAYGQTGSGKTYTITGEPGVHSERGILPRTLEYIFDTVRKHPENLYSVEVAYLEVYNENGYDLLLDRKQREAATRLEDLPRVTIQENENGTMHLKNLSFRIVENEKEALQILIDGDKCRAISETPMNPRSSRSHCIFTIGLSVKKFGEDRYSSAKMHLVDLAGSERVYKCQIQGAILTEAKHINLSLHFLEQVIVCLGQENVSHVPYRNSLLTSILRDSLGGNCLTTMLANLSVSNFNLEETISTCRFAQRVALVRNDVYLTLDLDTKSENKLLRMENERLKKQIEEMKKDKTLETFSPKESTGSLEYYKNLVVQRDQEISRLIDILKREKSRRVAAFQEATPALPEIPGLEKLTEVPSSRLSPRKNDDSSPTRRQPRGKSLSSLQGKVPTSPRKNEVTSPLVKKKMKSRSKNPERKMSSVPELTLEQDDREIKILKNIPELKVDRGTLLIEKNMEETSGNKIADTEKPGVRTKQEKSVEKTIAGEKTLGKNEELLKRNSPREKSPEFPRNVMKIIGKSCNLQDENFGDSKPQTPKSNSRKRNDLQNISSLKKNSEGTIEAGEISSRTRDSAEEKNDNNFGKLPLTGDPEIDEEIIAFYRAKRGGGFY